ncbi:MAG: hypothetical protein ACOYNC_14110 [Bacteroidales bacterium]
MKTTMFGLVVCLALTGACKKSSTSPGYTPDCSGTAKSFSSDVLPVINSACKSCHSDYSNYSRISGDKAAIRSTIVNGSMPEGSTMSAAQKNTVVCWIDNGAPNN